MNSKTLDSSPAPVVFAVPAGKAARDAPLRATVTALVSLGGKLSIMQLAPLLMSLYLAGVVARQAHTTFAAYALVTTINLTLIIAAMNFLQVLYFLGGRARGRNDEVEYRAAITVGVMFALAVGVVSMLVSAAIGPVLGRLDFPPLLVRSAAGQGLAAAIGQLPLVLLTVFRVHAVLNGRPGLVTYLAVGGALLGVLFATLAAHSGAANADAVARYVLLAVGAVNWLMLGAAIVATRAVPGLSVPRSPPLAPGSLRYTAAQTWTLGWPIGVVVLLDNATTLLSSLLMGRWWVAALPAHSAVLLWIVAALILPLGIAQAAVRQVAIAHARHDFAERNRTAAAALSLTLGWGLIVICVFSAFPVSLGALLLAPSALSADSRALLQMLMPLGGVVLALQGVIIVAAAVLRGIGQTRAPMIQALIGYAVFCTGGQLLFAVHLGLGPTGIWWGLVLGFGVTALAVSWRCRGELRREAAAVASPLS